MQQSDLKEVAQLFEKVGASANAKGDKFVWSNRFEEFCDDAMRMHTTRLKFGADSKSTLGDMRGFEKSEVLRARFSLWDIVEERLYDILRDYDKTVAEVVKELKSKRLTIFQEVCSELASLSSSMRDEPLSVGSSDAGGEASMNGIAAFAKARRKASDPGTSEGAASPTASMSLRIPARSVASSKTAASPRASPRGGGGTPMTQMNTSKKFYEDALDDEGDTRRDASSPASAAGGRFSKSPASLIYGTAGTQRGGPAALGAGPQDFSIRKPEPLSTHSYTTLHKTRVDKKKLARSPTGTNLARPICGPGKDLCLRQLRDLIASIYASKKSLDNEHQRRDQPRITLERHLYQYLGDRYDVKSAVQEWAAAIYKAVQKYAPRESDVAVFGKVLRNTLAESFPVVQGQVSDSLSQFLKEGIEAKYPSRPQNELDSLWSARTRAGFPLSECSTVISYMYNEDDAEKLMVKLKHASTNTAVGQNEEPLSPDSVRLKDVIQILLSFQMSLTEAFLKEFVEIFKEINAESGTDKDGILKLEELEELVRRVGYVDDLADNSPAGAVLLEARNTTFTVLRNYKKGATFSECVDMFTGLISARWGALNPLESP